MRWPLVATPVWRTVLLAARAAAGFDSYFLRVSSDVLEDEVAIGGHARLESGMPHCGRVRFLLPPRLVLEGEPAWAGHRVLTE